MVPGNRGAHGGIAGRRLAQPAGARRWIMWAGLAGWILSAGLPDVYTDYPFPACRWRSSAAAAGSGRRSILPGDDGGFPSFCSPWLSADFSRVPPTSFSMLPECRRSHRSLCAKPHPVGGQGADPHARDRAGCPKGGAGGLELGKFGVTSRWTPHRAPPAYSDHRASASADRQRAGPVVVLCRFRNGNFAGRSRVSATSADLSGSGCSNSCCNTYGCTISMTISCV